MLSEAECGAFLRAIGKLQARSELRHALCGGEAQRLLQIGPSFIPPSLSSSSASGLIAVNKTLQRLQRAKPRSATDAPRERNGEKHDRVLEQPPASMPFLEEVPWGQMRPRGNHCPDRPHSCEKFSSKLNPGAVGKSRSSSSPRGVWKA
jgi:hypothetical protein